MNGINLEITRHLQSRLTDRLITQIELDDPARVSIVKIGTLDGEPDPADGRITIKVHENDPDALGGTEWVDEIVFSECGGSVTWSRKFSVKARALLVDTMESLEEARSIASTLKSRIELALLSDLFTGVQSGNEYVSRGITSEDLEVEMLQGGGPPDSYDFQMKFRFDIWTTLTGVYDG
nr:hypothetical protein [Anaerolineae bacterium]